MFYQGKLQQVFGKHALLPGHPPEAILAVGYTVVQPLIRQLGAAKTFSLDLLHAVELSQVVPLSVNEDQKIL